MKPMRMATSLLVIGRIDSGSRLVFAKYLFCWNLVLSVNDGKLEYLHEPKMIQLTSNY